MTLRELITKLEEFSFNGEFDDMRVCVLYEGPRDDEIKPIQRINPYYDSMIEESFIAIDLRYGRPQ